MGFRTLYIEEGVKLSYKGNNVVVTFPDGSQKYDSLENVSNIIVASPHSYVSSYLLFRCADEKIPVIFCNDKYLPKAQTIPLFGTHNCAKTIKDQVEWNVVSKKQVWQKIVIDKITLQSEMLLYTEKYDEAAKLVAWSREVKSDDSTNREAVAAKLYFDALFEDNFKRREDSGINACLDFGYSVMMSRVAREIVCHGYSNLFGIHHCSQVNEWNLACDFVEPFRPIIDFIVYNFENKQLTKQNKKAILELLETDVIYKGAKYKLTSVVNYYVLDCLRALNKSISASEIERYSIPCEKD